MPSNVAIDGALGNLKLLCQLAGRGSSMELEHHQDGQQPVGSHQEIISENMTDDVKF